jgi:hypothetical protein
MRHRHLLAATALLAASIAAHAEHFQYAVSLSGTYSQGGTEGCFPPDFDQPACPRTGSLSALLSFDTPANGDGYFSIQDHFGDITNFTVNLGWLPEDALYGGIEVTNGAPHGSVQALDQSEYFDFDWATRTATYTYDYGYHGANGTFAGTLAAVPEPGMLTLMLAALVGVAGIGRRRVHPARVA